jgi:hypothetical protein
MKVEAYYSAVIDLTRTILEEVYLVRTSRACMYEH